MSMIRFYLEGNIKNKIFSGGSRGGAKGPGLSAPPLLSQGMDDPPPPPLSGGLGPPLIFPLF